MKRIPKKYPVFFQKEQNIFYLFHFYNSKTKESVEQ